jgi:hypothetical protein
MTDSGASRLRTTPRETVELTESEHIVPRGSERVHWLVRVRNGWTAAAAIPGARVESNQPEPGVVWSRRIELELARGTLLQRVCSSPRSVERSPLAHLQSPFSTPRRVLRTLHRVGGRGVLLREPSGSGRSKSR